MIMERPDTQTALSALSDGFRDAVAVVVGGRGGIGSQVVRQMRELGARVIVGSSSSGGDVLDEEAFKREGCAVLKVDIRAPRSVRRFAQEAARAEGRVDILVNTAGSSVQAALDQLTDDMIEDVFRSNSIGVLTTIREFAPFLKKGRDPVIVNVGSVAAKTGGGSNIAYVGAKAAVDAMSVGLAKTLAPEIRIVGVAPSALETGFAKGRGEDFLRRTAEATPLKRLTRTSEVASAVLVAARVLTATTGVTIAVDGGRHL